MPQTVKIITRSERLYVYTPYNSDFVADAKKRNAKWSPGDGAWIFHPNDLSWAREACLQYFATDGERHEPTCTLRVRFADGATEYGGPIAAEGRVIARAWGRDSGAKLGDDVVLEQGRITSGGSMKNWTTVIRPGSVFLIRDFPLKTAQEWVARNPEDEIVDETPAAADAAPDSLDALSQERDRLNARLAELDAERAAIVARAAEVAAVLDRIGAAREAELHAERIAEMEAGKAAEDAARITTETPTEE